MTAQTHPETGRLSSQPPRQGSGPDLVSIVVPVYNEAANIQPLAIAVAEALAGQAYELIFVDDGSDDATFENIDRLSQGDARVRGVSLSRNFGHQHALAAGLRFAEGQAVITMDGDMQHPPSLLPVLIAGSRLLFGLAAWISTRRPDGKIAGEPSTGKRGLTCGPLPAILKLRSDSPVGCTQ